jgi:magnesium chelatase family protein
MNPCRCGFLADAAQACPRAPRCGADYQNKLSGPLLDRFDLFVDVPAVSIDDLQQMPNGEASRIISRRVAKARDKQKFGVALINTRLQGEPLENVTKLDDTGQALMKQAAEKLKLSARAYHRVLRVARTIADLADNDNIQTDHLAEALAFRRRFDIAA